MEPILDLSVYVGVHDTSLDGQPVRGVVRE